MINECGPYTDNIPHCPLGCILLCEHFNISWNVNLSHSYLMPFFKAQEQIIIFQSGDPTQHLTFSVLLSVCQDYKNFLQPHPNLLLAMFWLGIAASNSVTRKTTGLASGTCNLTSSKLHRHKIMKNDVMVVNIRVPRLMRPGHNFSYLILSNFSVFNLQWEHRIVEKLGLSMIFF